MSAESILTLIIGILVINFLWEQFLDILNLKHQRSEIPAQLKDVVDEETYRKTLEYQKVKSRFGIFTAALGMTVLLIMLLFGVFGWLDGQLRPHFDHPIILALVYFAVLFFASDILSTPIQWYRTFVIEARFGFNKTTLQTFIIDKLKGYALAVIIGAPLMALLLYLIIRLGPGFWIYFLGVMAIFSLLINMFYTSWILPLFNKLSPLEDGELKQAIEDYSHSVSFPLDNIFVIDGSKRSNKSNAFFSGLGRKKKIVLYDTLIENHSTAELVSILAHEVGHYKKKHIVQGYFISLAQSGLMLYLLSLMVNHQELSSALGGSQSAIHLNLLAFGMLYTPISKVLGLLFNMLSRKNEYQADAYAANTFSSLDLRNALKKLSLHNLSNLWPHPLFVFFHYSHPPLLQRLRALERHDT